MGISERGIERFKALVAEVVASRAPAWTVSFEREADSPGEAVSVLLTHPLSNGRQIGFRAQDVEEGNTTLLEVVISESLDVEEFEFTDIAAAPEEPPNAALLGALREQAHIHGWTHAECQGLAAVLEAHGCLTHEEAVWFGLFTGEGAPRTYDHAW